MKKVLKISFQFFKYIFIFSLLNILFSCNSNPFFGNGSGNPGSITTTTTTIPVLKVVKIPDEDLPMVIDKDDYNRILSEIQVEEYKNYFKKSYTIDSYDVQYNLTDTLWESDVKTALQSIGYTTDKGLMRSIYVRQYDANYPLVWIDEPNGIYEHNLLCGVANTAIWTRLLRYYDNNGEMNPPTYNWIRPSLSGMANFYEDYVGIPISDILVYALTASDMANAMEKVTGWHNYFGDGWGPNRILNYFSRTYITGHRQIPNLVYQGLKLEEKSPIIICFLEFEEYIYGAHVAIVYGITYDINLENKYTSFDDITETERDQVKYYILNTDTAEPIFDRDTSYYHERIRCFNPDDSVHSAKIGSLSSW